MPSSRRALLLASLAVVALTVGIGLLAATAPPSGVAADGGPADDNASVPDAAISRLHETGYTGDGVSVGVVDVTGFRTDHPALRSTVAATRSFGDGDARRMGHGTAAAAVAARVAPDADLYLASFDDAAGYRAAVEWLADEDVDVIVTPVSFFGRPGDGSAPVSRAATDAVQRGSVFVAPAGNVAGGHWTGRYDRVADGRLRFAGGTRNYLQGGAGRVRAWLSWRGSGGAYALELYRTDGRRSELVARSTPVDGVPRTQRLAVRTDPGTHYLVVRGPSNATGDRLRLTSPTSRFQFGDAAGSVVAPATAQGVLAVGAYDRDARRIQPFSARGPTRDGRLGLDVVAPDDTAAVGVEADVVGTSVAAPYAAGVAALALDADPGLTPRAVETRLEASATDVGPPGVDSAAGYGLVAPLRAVPPRNASATGTNES